MTNSNDEHYDQRLDFIKTLLSKEYGLRSTNIETIEYEFNFNWQYNNFIYKVDVTPVSDEVQLRRQPGIQPLPKNVNTVIVRLANNRAMGVASSNRVENEVAATSVVRDALRSEKLDHLVPAIYGWASASGNSQGYTLMQYMPGSMMDFGALDNTGKQSILDQMAQILAAIQNYTLPETVTKFGGLSYDEDGNMISGAMTINPAADTPAGPYDTYADLYAGFLSKELLQADSNPVTQGWQANEVRDRIDILQNTIPKILGPLAKAKKTLISADFTTANLLFDKQSNKVTAILDFDFAFVGTAADEYLRSLHGSGGNLPGPCGDGDPELRAAVLSGFAGHDGPSTDEWTMAKQWDQALKKYGAQRPCEIEGLDVLSKLQWFISQINPFRLTVTRLRDKLSEEEKEENREKAEARIVLGLEGFGV
jgi:hypothetical protein